MTGQGALAAETGAEDLVDFFDNGIVALHFVGPDGTILKANQAELDLLGYGQADYVGRHIADFHADRGTIEDILARLAGGSTLDKYPARLRTRDGSIKHVLISSSALFRGGKFVHTRCFTIDVTELRQAEERRQLLINELNHRVKNTLATVQSIASQTFGSKIDKELQESFEARLLALAKAHDALTREDWQGADLYEVVLNAAAFSPGQEDRFDIAGPQLRLSPKAVVPLTMALHELCANASKYGALSVAEGRVSIHWRMSSDPDRAVFRWVEQGGPPVEAPATKGFGSRFLEQGLAHELQARVKLEYPRSGVVFELELPWRK
jgi:PAS domain S-box-containing protein